ncbi:MAG: hypothetical protein WCT77_05380, partial [Bacteroidota bacterium]
MKSNILIVISTNTYFPELFKASLVLKESKIYTPIVLFSGYYPTIVRDINLCLEENLITLDDCGNRIIKREKSTSIVSHMLGDILPIQVFNLLKRINFARRVITNNDIKIVVLGGDLVHYDASCYINAAHKQKIAAVIIPCTMSNALEMAESYSPIEKYSMKKLFNRVIGKIFSEWAYSYKGKDLIRLPAGQVLALKILGLSPPHPWINNSGYADYILAESKAMIEYYMQGGIPRNQIALTGSISHDILAKGLKDAKKKKRELYFRLKLPLNKPLILTALPPDQLYMVGGRPKCVFKTYIELVEYWVRTLVDIKKSNIIVNLHPSVSAEEYKYLEKFGIKLCSDDIAK